MWLNRLFGRPSADNWEDIASRKAADTASRIPREWMLDESQLRDARNRRDLTGDFITGLLPDKVCAITALSAPELTEGIRKRKFSATEVALAYCRRAAVAHQVNNCLHEIFFDQAIKRAGELDNFQTANDSVVGPLHGVPISLKDQFYVKSVETRFMSTSIESLKLIQKALLSAKPWISDAEVVPMPWRPEYEKIEKNLCFGLLNYDGYVMPHPPVLRALRLLQEALKQRGHRSLGLQREKYRQKYREYWNSTIELTGTGRPIDAFIMPVAPHAAVIPGKYFHYDYSDIVNLLDYTSVVIPVTKADKHLDKPNKIYQPVNEIDKMNWEAYDAEVYDGAPVGIQIVARQFQEERCLTLANEVVKALEEYGGEKNDAKLAFLISTATRTEINKVDIILKKPSTFLESLLFLAIKSPIGVTEAKIGLDQRLQNVVFIQGCITPFPGRYDRGEPKDVSFAGFFILDRSPGHLQMLFCSKMEALKVSDFLANLTSRFQTLEDLQAELRQLSATIQTELVDLVNDHYEEFLGLGESLSGGEEQVEEVRLGLMGVERELDVLKERVVRERERVAEAMELKRDVVREANVGSRLLDAERRLAELEFGMGIVSVAEKQGEEEGRAGGASANEESTTKWGEEWTREDADVRDLDLDDEDEDEDDDFDEQDGKDDSAAAEKDNRPPRPLTRRVEQWLCIKHLLSTCDLHHPFLVAEQPRLKRVKDTLLRDIDAATRARSDAKGKQRLLELRREMED
ncbi:hypothetical protein DV737_g1375, partial [Chaetothyriales sp. CBS 132003]